MTTSFDFSKTITVLERAGDLQEAVLQAEDCPERSCRQGCHWCCYEPLFALPEEIAVVVAAIRSMRPLAQEIIRGSMEAWVRRYRSACQSPRDLDAYRAAELLCPFCEISSRDCNIYRLRPLGCRFYVSVSPPDLCRPDRKEHGQTPMVPDLMAAAWLALRPQTAVAYHFAEALAFALFPGGGPLYPGGLHGMADPQPVLAFASVEEMIHRRLDVNPNSARVRRYYTMLVSP